MYLPSAMQADISRGMSRMDPFSERRCCAARTWQVRRGPALLRNVCRRSIRMCITSISLFAQRTEAPDHTAQGQSCPNMSDFSHLYGSTPARNLARATTNIDYTRGFTCLMLSSFCSNWLKFFPASVRAPSMSLVSSVRWLFAAGPAPVQVSPPASPW